MFMRTYASSRVKRNSFYRKCELHMFLLISGGHIGGPKRSTNMARFHATTPNHYTTEADYINFGKVFCFIPFPWNFRRQDDRQPH